MDKIIIDASVAVKWIAKEGEQDRETALRIYDSVVAARIDAWAPAFLLVEIANILKQKKKLAQKEILHMMTEVAETGIHFTPLSAEETPEIISEAFLHNITMYDALYVHLAQLFDCRLLTYDSRLLEIHDLCLTPSAFLNLTMPKQ